MNVTSVAAAPTGMVAFLRSDPDTAVPVVAVMTISGSGSPELRFLFADTRVVSLASIARFEVVA